MGEARIGGRFAYPRKSGALTAVNFARVVWKDFPVIWARTKLSIKLSRSRAQAGRRSTISFSWGWASRLPTSATSCVRFESLMRRGLSALAHDTLPSRPAVWRPKLRNLPTKHCKFASRFPCTPRPMKCATKSCQSIASITSRHCFPPVTTTPVARNSGSHSNTS